MFNTVSASSTTNITQTLEECKPIDSIEEMLNNIASPPLWVQQLIDLVPRSLECVANSTLKCHCNLNDDPESLVAPVIPLNSVFRTIVCHDMKNGYLQDRFVDGTSQGNGYSFYLWQFIDMFIYFSHHFITIPPLPWINKAHENGVKIMGTVITEWDAGEVLCREILQDPIKMNEFIDGLVALSTNYKLDGWLINIENVIGADLMENLKTFLKSLTDRMHFARPGSVVLWYDSVITTGELKWQNELNDFNGTFFDLCDGILLNYSWKEPNLENTKRYIDQVSYRPYDVYVGIDVFGRNTSYGAGAGCAKALQQINLYNFSKCLFAPGWTHEVLEEEPNDNFLQRFYNNDNNFWRALWPYLHTHLTKDLFQTDFNIGTNTKCYKLSDQKLHLLHVPNNNTADTCDCLRFDFLVNRNCYVINCNGDRGTLYHLLAVSIELQGQYCLHVDLKLRPSAIDHVQLVLIIQDDVDIRMIRCRSDPDVCSKVVVKTGHLDDKDALVEVLICYQLDIQKAVRLRHIYATLPMFGEIYLHGIGLKAASFEKA